MSGELSRAPLRFCPGCGTPVTEAANFCTSCGAALRDSPARQDPPRREASPATPGVVVLTVFLAVGLTLWFAILRPEERSRRPLAPKTSAPSSGAPAGAASGEASLPADHPPVQLPEEVRTFIADLETKAEAAPDDVATWRQLAQVQFRAGQIDASYLDRAEASWRRVLEIEPGDPDGLRGLGNIHFDRDEYTKAIEAYEGYLEKRPEDVNVRTDLGTMLLYSGKPEDAIREYHAVIAAQPGFFQAHFNLGVAHLRLGETDEARGAFEKARDAAPDEDTRARIETMIQRAADGNAPAADAPAGFQARVERNLRAHPIAGPKVVGFEWTSPAEGRVLLEEFPMDAMPPFARSKFLERLQTEVEEARRAEKVETPARVELVDSATGKVMATVETK